MSKLSVDDVASQDHSTVLLHPSKLKELNLYEGDTVLLSGRKKKSTCVSVSGDSTVPVDTIRMTRVTRSNIRYVQLMSQSYLLFEFINIE